MIELPQSLSNFREAANRRPAYLRLHKGRRSRLRSIEALAHFLPALEERHGFLIDWDNGAAARIASGAGPSAPDRKYPKAANFNPVATRQRRHDLAKDRTDDVLDIPQVEMWILRRNALN
jgi:hypothetical protein